MAGTPQVVTITDNIPLASADQAAVATTAVTTTTPYGFSTQAQGDALIALANAMRDVLVAAGLMKGSA